MATKVAVVLGVGPGIGWSVSKRFAREGYVVALLARNRDKLLDYQKQIEASGGKALAVEADAAVPASIKSAFDTIRSQLGHPQVLVVNTAGFKMGGILSVTPEELGKCLEVGGLGTFAAAQQVLPAMVERKSGTIIVTGNTAATRGSANFVALAAPSFAKRAIAQSIAREFGPKGIHCVHVIIDGQVDLEATRARLPERATETFLHPDAIADVYWNLHVQDKTTWTQELDLRPHVEKW